MLRDVFINAGKAVWISNRDIRNSGLVTNDPTTAVVCAVRTHRFRGIPRQQTRQYSRSVSRLSDYLGVGKRFL